MQLDVGTLFLRRFNVTTNRHLWVGETMYGKTAVKIPFWVRVISVPKPGTSEMKRKVWARVRPRVGNPPRIASQCSWSHTYAWRRIADLVQQILFLHWVPEESKHNLWEGPSTLWGVASMSPNCLSTTSMKLLKRLSSSESSWASSCWAGSAAVSGVLGAVVGTVVGTVVLDMIVVVVKQQVVYVGAQQP
ncbi:hypothetical protein B0H16DRAFT_1460478 [Mycena metata]|uniref:Uncharacterized protein n=1 Tax=Mycena metata TaxID=1033252 RepID=A0AAD7IWF0_9AGAR|nr:hypothetical protein B0H16DRAFT_1460478 [Mycena metata]